jgi:hypothetical protein
LPVPLPFPTVTGVWKWRIVGGGEDRRHINTPPARLDTQHTTRAPTYKYKHTRTVQRLPLKPTAALVGTGGRRRAREKYREGQRGDFHSAKDPRNGLEIF